MTDGNGVVAGLANSQRGGLVVGEVGFLGDDEIVTYKLRGREEVHVEGFLTVVAVDVVSILGMVLHTRTHTAPHALVHRRIDAVALWAQGGEVDVAARLRILGREDVVPHGLLIEVDILGIACAVGQHLGELQHVVGVTRLRTV